MTICSPNCNDGFLVAENECEDGNGKLNDGCSENCKVEEGWSCTGVPSVCNSICGDGKVKGSEECEPGSDGYCFENCTIDKESKEFKSLDFSEKVGIVTSSIQAINFVALSVSSINGLFTLNPSLLVLA